MFFSIKPFAAVSGIILYRGFRQRKSEWGLPAFHASESVLNAADVSKYPSLSPNCLAIHPNDEIGHPSIPNHSI
jgi:hypothetical protein